MQTQQNKLTELDLAYPVHVHPEAPPNFNKQASVIRARKCVAEIEQTTSLRFIESPIEVAQDASLFAEFNLVCGEHTNSTLLFSAFGDLVSIVNERVIKFDNIKTIQDILNNSGFYYLPENIRLSPRPKGRDSYVTWGDRFFSYL